MSKEERKRRILARGEFSNHSHVVVGDALVKEEKGNIIVVVGNEGAVLKHIFEKEWVEEGKKIWTGEHEDIKLEKGIYDYVPQINYDPLTKRIIQARD